jgi:hypothetical protein
LIMKWIKVLMSYCTWQQPKQNWFFKTLQISRKFKTETKAVLLSRKKLTMKFTVTRNEKPSYVFKDNNVNFY